MGRTVKDPNRRQPKPVQKVQLSEKNVGRRIVLVVLFLAIGSGFLVFYEFSARRFRLARNQREGGLGAELQRGFHTEI